MIFFIVFGIVFAGALILSLILIFSSPSVDKRTRELENQIQVKNEEIQRLKRELESLKEVYEGLKAQYEELESMVQEKNLKEI